MARIVLDGISKVFGDDVIAVDDVSLEIGDGEFMVLVGPSGCGKSTILRMIAGLEEVTAGEIDIGDRRSPTSQPKDRDIAMVFQNYALYPHMTVEQNLGFGLKLRKTPKDGAQATRARCREDPRARAAAWSRKPAELSGGQRQRVAMGRAMVREPKAFLMDEPLSNLDAKLRVQMRAELTLLHDRLGTTTVYVTHDQVEAMTLGERVAVLRDGVLQQVDTPQNLYTHPANLFVAAFIGSPPMNLVEAKIDGGTLKFGGFEIPVRQRRARGLRTGDRDPRDPSGRHGRRRMWRRRRAPTIAVQRRRHRGARLRGQRPVPRRRAAGAADVIMAATDEEGDASCSSLADDTPGTIFCARVDARTTAQPGGEVTPLAGPGALPLLRPRRRVSRSAPLRTRRAVGVGSSDATSAERRVARGDVRREPAFDRRARPRRAEHAHPAAGELRALDHRGQPEWPGSGAESGRDGTRPRRRSRGRSPRRPR